MGVTWIAQDVALAQARAQIAERDARIATLEDQWGLANTDALITDGENEELRATIAGLEALILLRGIHIAKQDETIADLRAELASTLAKLGDVTRGNHTAPEYGGEGTA